MALRYRRKVAAQIQEPRTLFGTESSSRRSNRRPEIAVESLALLTAVLLVAGNVAFWRGALGSRSLAELWTWRFAAATFCGLVALYVFAVCLLATRRTVRPLLAILIAVSSLSGYFMHRYGIVIDAQMLRNVLHTDMREAAELFGADTFMAALLALAAAAAPWSFRLRRRAFGRALVVRACVLGTSLLVAVLALAVAFQDLSSLLRNDGRLRHAITPANVVWALTRVIVEDARAGAAPRAAPDKAERVLVSASAPKPVLFVMVLGETARAANFSLNGYARATNAELERLDVINFLHTQACGTSTEISLPCMFSPFGRAGYDAVRIRGHEPLPQLLARAGLRVIWVDNQSGCKGVCDGLEFHDVSRLDIPGVCAEGHCYDEVLLHSLKSIARELDTDSVVILHQIGNHGPAYFRRYPPALKRFAPACEQQELRNCSRDEIVNAYDNAIAYTDRFLADTIRFLDDARKRFRVALLYVSDHGESLGEHGLYLHGMPFAIAPREQLEVPMLWWLPPDFADSIDVDLACLRERATRKASHDNIYHSLLGLLGVRTERYRSELDVFHGCRGETSRAQRLVTLGYSHRLR